MPMKRKEKTANPPPAIEWTERQVDVAALKPYERNPRRISREAFTRLVNDIRRNGYHQRIIATADLRVIGGHQRIRALKEIGLKKVKILVPDREIGDEQFREMLIKDNLPFGEFDMEMLAADFDISELVDWGMPEEWLDMPDPVENGLTDADEVPPVPDAPVSKTGDIWLLGDHRLMCGDSTNPEDVSKLADGKLAAMVFTDPPYGVAYRDTGAGAWNAKKLAKKKAGTLKPRFAAIENDDLNEADLHAFLVAYMRCQPLDPNAAQYVCHASLRAHVFREALLDTGYLVRAELIWAKSRPGFNFAQYKHKHEPIYYAVPKKEKVHWYGDAKQTTLWEVASESGTDYVHPTQKPVGLPLLALQNSSRSGDAVYEPFSGSGTTLIACQMTDRRCLAMELNSAYVDVAVKRWQSFTGKDAVHAETGELFNSRIPVSPAREADSDGMAPGE